MDVSVIIPTYNRGEILEKAIERLEVSMANIKSEVIIIDDGSDKDNWAIVKKIDKKYPNILLLKNYEKGPASARNLGIKKSSGKILLFVNDDTIVEKDFVHQHLSFHKRHPKKEVALFGKLTEPSWIIQSPPMKWLTSNSGLHFKYIKSGEKPKRAPWYYFWTCNVSVKSDFIKKHQLFFDTSFPTAAWEDIEYGYRLKKDGLKLYFDKRIVAYHDHAFEFDDVMARFFSHGRGLYNLYGKIPGKIMPPLSKKLYRQLFKSFSFLIGGEVGCRWLKNKLKTSKTLPNLLMQYLVINEKIKGFEYEEKKRQVR